MALPTAHYPRLQHAWVRPAPPTRLSTVRARFLLRFPQVVGGAKHRVLSSNGRCELRARLSDMLGKVPRPRRYSLR
ncbi:hypothetical protein BC826DRAFT_1041969 [Russula brevipes]|nr:hypothetical protein BC826DRAFT_1041969 [Russula brevipes]